MIEDTSKTPAGNVSGAESAVESGEQEVPEKKPPGTVREKEIGGRGGLDPTRYGDWEKDGRCIDF